MGRIERFLESKPGFAGAVIACLSLWMLVLILLFAGCGVVTEHPPVLLQPTATPTPTPDFHPNASAPVVRSNVTTQQQGLKCVDTLGLPMQDVPMIAANLRPGFALGCLEGTFGACIPALETVAATGKLAAFRAHLLNGSCWRGHNCAADEPALNDLGALGRRAAAFEAFHQRHPTVGCFLSRVLESDERDANKIKAQIATIQKNAPSCQIVQSVSGTGLVLPGYLVERHSTGAHGDITSNDGQTLFDTNAEVWSTSGKVMTCGWTSNCNLRVSEELSWTPPKKRTKKLTKDDFLQIQDLLAPPTAKPTMKPAQCKTVLPISQKPVKELWKTNTEDPGNGAPRNNKPALISHLHASDQFAVLSPAGVKIGCLKFFANYGAGLYRYYSGLCSGDTGESFMRKAGGEWIYLEQNGQCYLVSSIRRTGYYH